MGDGAQDALDRAFNQEFADMIEEENEGMEFAGIRVGPDTEAARHRRYRADTEAFVRNLPFPFNT